TRLLGTACLLFQRRSDVTFGAPPLEQQTARFLKLIQDDRCSRGNLCIEPCDIIRVHVNAAVAPVTIEAIRSLRIVVREVIAGAKVVAPPSVMEEVATLVKLHGILNGCWGVPESRS